MRITEPPKTLTGRLLWFAILWAASLLAVGVVAYALRGLLFLAR